MRGPFIVLSVLMLCPARAQVLLVEPGTSDPLELHFNPAFIGRNAVVEVSGLPMVKRKNEPMREKREKHLFRFNELGRTIYSNNSFGQPGTGRDTASITYTYDALGHITEELHNDLSGHYALVRELDPEGRPLRETYTRIENLGTDRYELVPGARTEISDERFRHETINDTARKVVFMNSAGLPFREQTWKKDHWGYLREIEDRWLVTGRMGLTTFRYDEKGHLAERIERPDMAASGFTKVEWRYDAAGNVTLCDMSRETGAVTHTEYLYENGTMFLKATVSDHLDTGLIHVTRYTTQRR